MIKVGVVVAVMLASGVASADLVAPRVAPREVAKPWSQLRIEFVEVATKETRQDVSVYPDGRVVFDGGGADGAPTVAHAPADLLDKVATIATHLPPSQPTGKAEYAVRVTVRTTSAASVHTYDYTKIPASVNEIYLQAGGLRNSPRTPLPCAAWDGKGDFTLTTVSQNFGVAPGPINRLSVKSDGSVTSRNEKGTTTTKASPDELAALRKAAHDVDLGHFTDIYAGAGEGSNLRMVNLKTAAGSCGRAFTNQYPDAMKPLLDALGSITTRLK